MKFEKRKINIQKYKLVAYHFLTYSIIYVLLGIIAMTLINIFFFRDVINEMRSYQKIIEENIVEREDSISIGVQRSARIATIFYDDKDQIIAYDSDILSYLIDDFEQLTNMIYRDRFRFNEQYSEYVDQINLALKNDIFQKDQWILNDFRVEIVQTNEEYHYHFQTLTFELNNPSAPNIKACKLLMMINGEIDSRNEIVRIYVWSAAMMFVFGVIASLLLSSWAIKPIKASLDKQLTFVSDASHELRTPLAIVQSRLDNILTMSSKKVYDVSSDIAIALKEISRLSKLTKDLLILAQSDNDIYELKLEKFNLFQLINDVSSPFLEIAQIQNKQFLITGDNNVIIEADKSKIMQTLIIILDNALKYTSDNETVTINLSQSINECIITISDTGIGMSDVVKNHIFERFYRADKARSRETGGNGLGLSIAKTIVNQHKGDIIVSDNLPKGSKFTITLPKKF